jgi:hypothetical protein
VVSVVLKVTWAGKSREKRFILAAMAPGAHFSSLPLQPSEIFRGPMDPPAQEVCMMKSVRRWLPMVFLAVFAGILGSCSTVKSFFGEPVNVVFRGDLTAAFAGDPAAIQFVPDTVWVPQGQSIKWTNNTDGTLTLRMEEVPVTPHMVVIPPGGTRTVRVDGDARPGLYKYGGLIRRGDETIPVDPYIDIPPPPVPRDTLDGRE